MNDDVFFERDLEYARHDGVVLKGHLWRPTGAGPHPAVIAIPGGAWQQGGPDKFREWGPWLAARGWAVFGIGYRLSSPTQKSWPECFLDARAAVQFIKGRSREFHIDGDRVSVFGDSAGGHIAALIALAGDRERFSTAYPDDPFHEISTRVRCVAGVYGVYDLGAQWMHDQRFRPNDHIVQKLIGSPLYEDRQTYFEASPLSYAVRAGAGPSFLLIHGAEDDVVDRSQTDVFHGALRLAGFYSRRLIAPGAGHYFVTDPADEPDSLRAWLMPRVLRFLIERG